MSARTSTAAENLEKSIDELYENPRYSLYSFTPQNDVVSKLKTKLHEYRDSKAIPHDKATDIVTAYTQKVQPGCMEPTIISLYIFTPASLRSTIPELQEQTVVSKVSDKSATVAELITMLSILRLKKDRYWGKCLNKLIQCPASPMAYNETQADLRHSLYVSNEVTALALDEKYREGIVETLSAVFHTWESNCATTFQDRQVIHATFQPHPDPSKNIGFISAQWQIPANKCQTTGSERLYIPVDATQKIYTNITDIDVTLQRADGTEDLPAPVAFPSSVIDEPKDVAAAMSEVDVGMSQGPHFDPQRHRNEFDELLDELNEERLRMYQLNYFDEMHHDDQVDIFPAYDYKRSLYIAHYLQQWARDIKTIEIPDADGLLSLNYDWLFVKNISAMFRIVGEKHVLPPLKLHPNFPVAMSDVRIGYFSLLAEIFSHVYYTPKITQIHVQQPYIMKYMSVEMMRDLFEEWLRLEFGNFPDHDKTKRYASTKFRYFIYEMMIPSVAAQMAPPPPTLFEIFQHHLAHMNCLPDAPLPFVGRYYYKYPLTAHNVQFYYPLVRQMGYLQEQTILKPFAFHYLSQQLGYVNNVLQRVIVSNINLQNAPQQPSGARKKKKTEKTELLDKYAQPDVLPTEEELSLIAERSYETISTPPPSPERAELIGTETAEELEFEDIPPILAPTPVRPRGLLPPTPPSSPASPVTYEVRRPASPVSPTLIHALAEISLHTSPPSAASSSSPKIFPVATTPSTAAAPPQPQTFPVPTPPSAAASVSRTPKTISRADIIHPTIPIEKLKQYILFEDNEVSVQVNNAPIEDFNVTATAQYSVMVWNNTDNKKELEEEYTDVVSSLEQVERTKVNLVPKMLYYEIERLHHLNAWRKVSLTYFVNVTVVFRVQDARSPAVRAADASAIFYKQILEYLHTEQRISYGGYTPKTINAYVIDLPWKYVRHVSQTIFW